MGYDSNPERYKSINGIMVGKAAKDLTGLEFGRLRIIELLGKHNTRSGLIWMAECSCGNLKEVCSSDLSSGSTRSCGCLEREVRGEHMEKFSRKYSTHGLSGTKEYDAWKRIIQRCTNPLNPDYEVYSKIGVCEEFRNDFLLFLEEIGEVPDRLRNWSVDRKDNTKGYIIGNVRWATDPQQARNKGRYSNNKSGVTGVYAHTAKGREYWVATWKDLNTGKSKTRNFSIAKFGDEFAFFLACECRSLAIRRMNLLGAGYSESHGSS